MIVRAIVSISVFIAYFGLPCARAAQDTSASNVTPVLSPVANIQDFSKTVIPITELKLGIRPGLGLHPAFGAQARFGTGFCLDPVCRFIVTTYHVAAIARPHKIKGDKVIHRYFATSPKDIGATLHAVPGVGPISYTLNRDLAIFELKHEIPHHHGLAFSLDELERGQAVDIYAYPLEGINPFRKLMRFSGTFKGETPSGILLFDYRLSDGMAIRPGASGGIVVDKHTDKIVGVLTEVGKTSEPIAMAVPIQSLADFVCHVQPILAQKIFPAANEEEVLPVSGDFYPEFVPVHAQVLKHRQKEPYQIRLLRKKAQLLAESMRNFIAVQTVDWGSDGKELTSEEAYEVRVIDGNQRFRSYPSGKKELEEPPHPPLGGWVLPSDEWSELPEMVGTKFQLTIREAPDVVLGERRIKVFQYYASREDNVCSFEPEDDYGLFTIKTYSKVGCYGEVWTDKKLNIIRISRHLNLSEKLKAYRGWDYHEVVLTYGWLRRPNEPRRLIPLTTFIQGHNGKHIYWCRGQFTDYQVFSVHASLIRN